MTAKKAITKRQARRVARLRAGLIVESVLAAGWRPDELVRRYGEEGVEEITEQLAWIANWLAATAHPDASH